VRLAVAGGRVIVNPLVSIIVPCYNAARFVSAALDSALAQTWPACEVIVVDDGSRDESLAVARRYEARGVRVLTQPNRGAAAARNAGLRAAQGTFIQFLDADDLLASDKIAQQMRVFAGGDTDILSSSAWARFHVDPAEADFSPHPNWRDLNGVEFLQLHFEGGWMMQPAAWLAPRALLDRAGPWDEALSLNDDGEYFARVMLAARRIAFCGAARIYYRAPTRGNLSARRDRRACESLHRSIELTLTHLLAADNSPRSLAAAAYAWKWTAFELFPGAPDLSRRAEAKCRELGGSPRPFPAGGRFQLVSRFLGWRLAKRLCG
jgi:glycosyltransferase involved in cell wall biosynthesis